MTIRVLIADDQPVVRDGLGLLDDVEIVATAADGIEAVDDGAQPLRGGVDGSGEPRGPRADDDDVVQLALGLRAQPSAARQLAAPVSACQVRIGSLRWRSRGHCHPDMRFVARTLGPSADPRRSRVDELLWRRQLRAVREHSDRPWGSELEMLGEQPTHGIGVGVNPAMRHAVAA